MTSSEPGRQSWQGAVLRDLAPEPTSTNVPLVGADPTIEPDDSTATQVVDPAALGVTAPIPTGIPPAADVPGAEATTMLPRAEAPPARPFPSAPAAIPAPQPDPNGFPQSPGPSPSTDNGTGFPPYTPGVPPTPTSGQPGQFLPPGFPPPNGTAYTPPPGAPAPGAPSPTLPAPGFPTHQQAMPAGLPGQQPPMPGHSKVFGPDATPIPQQWTPTGLLPMPDHADSRLQRLRSSVRGTGRASRDANSVASELSQPVATSRRIAVLGIRGGSGKSTVAALLVSAYATHRGDRVLAVDADPDLGSLGLRLGANSPTSLANLGKVPRVWTTLDEAERCLGRSQSGAWILSGERDTATPETVPPNAYLGVLHGISRYFAVTVVDAGAGLVTPLNQAVLADAHSIVLATPASVDGVVSARRALEWIGEWNPQRLRQTMVALTAMSPQAVDIDLNRTAEAFAQFGVVPALLPYDRHLATGSTIEPWRLGERTRNSAVRLAAATLVRARVLS